MEHNFTVDDKHAGERLDKWLCQRLPQMSRSQIKALLDDGRVLVNRRRVLIAGWELEPHDSVEVRIPSGFRGERNSSDFNNVNAESEARSQRPEVRRVETSGPRNIGDSIERFVTKQRKFERPQHFGKNEKHGKQGRHEGPRLHLKVYHQDRDILIVDKPAGVLAVPADRNDRDKDTLLARIYSYMKRKHRGSKHSFVSPLHRLDVETSGVMVFALSKVGQKLERQFKDHTIRREYTAVAAGRVEQERGLIDIPLEKGDFHGGKKVRRAESGQGMLAVTEYRVKERYNHATLLEIRVRTGRTHQIRVHLAEKGFPLLGDKVYFDETMTGAPEFHRHALHAHFLAFKHPADGKKLSFHSPLPEDMKQLIDDLRS